VQEIVTPNEYGGRSLSPLPAEEYGGRSLGTCCEEGKPVKVEYTLTPEDHRADHIRRVCEKTAVPDRVIMYCNILILLCVVTALGFAGVSWLGVAGVCLFTALPLELVRRLLKPRGPKSLLWFLGLYFVLCSAYSVAKWGAFVGLAFSGCLFFMGGLIVLLALLFDPFRGIPVTSQSLEIRPEGLAATTERESSLTTWERIDRIVATDTHAFLGPYILPRRAFANEREFEDFVESARSYHEVAKLGSRPA
jgi:hypothetical protein